MSVYEFTAKKPDGSSYSLSEYEGKPMLIVNTATKCGLRDQFDGLEKLYRKYGEDGLVVLGFPSDQFAQELSDAEEAEKSCRMSYGVTFPMHDIVKVNGKEAAPLFKYLTENSKGFLGSSIKWNFTKFLIDKEGKLVARYSPKEKPESFEDEIREILMTPIVKLS
ncbi:glutathione peroxidase [Planococcus salinarum]|uniref:Glutathione peroxidase n=1 Tax=Planococcus salinarum TaxID=622695 RepID=A0ABX3D1R2_9BACL|nr:glutathione peroxidase [Planococcus salinarum]OHX52087.1 glutathione peroxidase [Planococcus salinarum]TAA65747.1 glutathione peroxidase [Planococcus salinarum]